MTEHAARTSTERGLGGLRHGICLVENDEFERILLRAKDIACACKSFDLATHNVNPTIIRCIQLNDVRT